MIEALGDVDIHFTPELQKLALEERIHMVG